MALSDLIARLEQDASSEARAISLQADADVHAIDAETERAIGDAAACYLDQQHDARRVVHERELALARREKRAGELGARHAQLARVLERARQLAPDVAASHIYLQALPSHLEEALSYVEGLRPRVRCQSAFATVLRPLVAQHEGAELVVDDAAGPGVMVEAANGSVVVDNTLVGRLLRIEAQLAVDLFAETEDGRD
jgi:vacuolar-type H+-ATPase subunit E/Vma4